MEETFGIERTQGQGGSVKGHVRCWGWERTMSREPREGREIGTMGIMQQVWADTRSSADVRENVRTFSLFSIKIKRNEVLLILVQIETSTCLKKKILFY